MFEQILVPIDRSLLAESILPHVIKMAQAYQSKVVLINVLDAIAGGDYDLPTDPLDRKIQRSGAEAYLREMANRLNDSGLSTETMLLEGRVPEHVIQHSNDTSTSLIMLSSHGRGGISSWNVSSVATKIILQARTSIMIVHPHPAQGKDLTDQPYQRILAPVDGSKRAEYGLAAAAYLAKSQGAELIVAHVIKPPELPRQVPLSAQEQELVRQVVECNRREAVGYLTELQASLGCEVKTRLLIADQVTEALSSLVEQEEIDLVVLNAHGLSGSASFPYGNVVVHFLTYGTVPLLIVQDFQRELLAESRAEIYADQQGNSPNRTTVKNYGENWNGFTGLYK